MFAASHIGKLDSIHRRTLPLVGVADFPAQTELLNPVEWLEHRRDIAALLVFHGAPHGKGAGSATPRSVMPTERVITWNTRTVA